MPDLEKAEAEFESLARDVEAWDGSAEAATALRERLLRLPPLGRKPGSGAEAVLSLLRGRYQPSKKGEGAPLADLPLRLETLSATWKRDAGKWAAPFLGDPAAGTWPYEDFWNLPDEDGARWARLLGRHALVDDAVRNLLLVFFLHRRRPMWLPASEGLACALRRDVELRERLSALWQRYFPELPPGRVPGPGWVSEAAKKKKEEKDEEKKQQQEEFARLWEEERGHISHVGRHLVYLASCFEAARGEAEPTPFTGFSAEWLASVRLRRGDPGKEKEVDRTDASVLFLSFVPLVRGTRTAPNLLAAIAERVRETGANEQTDEALRALATALEESAAGQGARPALEAVLARLREPTWRLEQDWKKRADALRGWLETATWFHGRGDSDSTGRMKALAPEAGRALELVLGAPFPGDLEDPVPTLLGPLSTVLDGDVFRTVNAATRALCLVESVLFLDREEVGALPWRSLVARAAGREAARHEPDVTVAEAGEVRIALLPHVREAAPALLLRDRRLSVPEVLGLAGEENGYVAGQVAVQVERLLREDLAPYGRAAQPTRERQIALLWRLLQRNPPNKTFDELRVMLRGLPRSLGGLPSPLAGVVGAVLELDELRDELEGRLPGRAGPDRNLVRIATAYAKLAREAAAYLEGEAVGSTARQLLQKLRKAAENEASCKPPTPGTERSWLDAARALVSDKSRGGALDAWAEWLDGKPVEGLAPTWEAFERAFVAAGNVESPQALALAHDLLDATKGLGLRLRGIAWPESRIVDCLLEEARSWSAACVERAVAAAERRLEEERRRRAEEDVRRTREERASAVRQILDSGKEAEIRSLVEPWDARLADVTADDVRRLHGFLLENVLLEDAEKVRERNTQGVLLKTPQEYFGPLFVGTAAGAFLVLDVGTAWNESVMDARWWLAALTAVVGILASFTLLSAQFARRLATSRGTSVISVTVLGETARRFKGIFLKTLGVSALVSLVVLATLHGTEYSVFQPGGPSFWPLRFALQLLLWASLSQFLGLFIGLILSGQRLTREENARE